MTILLLTTHLLDLEYFPLFSNKTIQLWLWENSKSFFEKIYKLFSFLEKENLIISRSQKPFYC